MLKTIGGDRLGSGSKMKAELHNYERSTHNLGNAWRSTMAPGVLVPFYKKIALNGDTWSEDLVALVRTMPAIGPCFGTFKLQMDIFEIPIRLYNGVLHNNWTKIGMEMGKVKLPKVEITGVWKDQSKITIPNPNTYQISSSSLMAYLGFRGIGNVRNATKAVESITREVQCVPYLAYYDIFKNYYANKQEKKAFVITGEVTQAQFGRISEMYVIERGWENYVKLNTYEAPPTTTDQMAGYTNALYGTSAAGNLTRFWKFNIFKFKVDGEIDTYTAMPNIIVDINNVEGYIGIDDQTQVQWWKYEDGYLYVAPADNPQFLTSDYQFKRIIYTPINTEEGKLKLQEFNLEYIDFARKEILQATDLNTTFYMNSLNYYPYKALYDVTSGEGNSMNKFKMNGLVLKTYQSDMFNNWLSREWIDGIGGITEITSIDVSGGTLSIDALNLAKKVYNMLNRIAVSGGTFQDWQEAVYGEDVVRMAESPIYCGGMSGLIQFEEVVSTADTETSTAGDQPLGSLAGKGVLTNVKGGQIEIHIKEPSYIMGIVSITPILDYCQGNDFDITELDSLNDLHKPALDQIGFQNLMLERAVWWGKEFDTSDSTWKDNAVGKLPAWIEYMTSVNQVYGDFADEKNMGFMVLTRNYEYGQSLLNGTNQVIPIEDWTTYINPTKFNYMFADTSLEAQNFWVQIGIGSEARRKMSAKIIPNL